MQLPYSQYSSITLSNNVRLDVYTKPNSPVVVHFNIKGGDAITPDLGPAGIAHFIEHILASGTPKFPSSAALNAYLDQYGIYFTASTNKERVRLSFTCPDPANLGIVFETLSTVLREPVLDDRIISSEKGAIQSELALKNATLSASLEAHFDRIAYAQTPYEAEVLGNRSSIDSFSPLHIQNWLAHNLRGGNIGILISGAITPTAAQALADHYLTFIPESETKRFVPDSGLPVRRVGNQIHHVQTPGENVSLMLGFRTPGLIQPNVTDDILAAIFGEGRSSLLKAKLRDELGTSYSPISQSSRYCAAGTFKITVTCRFDDLARTLDGLLSLIRQEFPALITAERVQLAKDKFQTQLIQTYETSSALADFGSTRTITTTGVALSDYADLWASEPVDRVIERARTFFSERDWILVYSARDAIISDLDL